MPATPRDHYEPLRPRDAIGGILFLLGIALLVFSIFASLKTTAWRLPDFWYRGQMLWPFAGLLMALAGWAVQRGGPQTPDGWKPGQSGKRFRRVIIYSRRECHLCDVAKDTLHAFQEWLPPIEEIDIEGDEELTETHGTSIPVVEMDGEIRFRGIVSVPLLKRLIEGTTPLSRKESVE